MSSSSDGCSICSHSHITTSSFYSSVLNWNAESLSEIEDICYNYLHMLKIS